MLFFDKIQNKQKLFTFFCLYIAQSIPMSFFSTAIPVLMRQYSFSLTTIALLQFIKLPWLLKFLWSPYVDRNTVNLKDYKRWIFLSELLYAILILSVCFFDFPEDMLIIGAIILSAFFASATQDIATDALATRSFSYSNRSLVNGMQSMGSFIGTLVGSGVLLLLFKDFGWSGILPSLALFVMIAIIPLFLIRMPLPAEPKQVQPAQFKDILSFFTQPGILRQVIFLFLCYGGLIGSLAMIKPLMVDLGYTMSEVGLISGIWGPFCAFLLSFFGGVMIKKIGRYHARRLFALVVFVTALFLFVNSLIGFSGITIVCAVMFLWSAYGVSTVVVWTTAMDHVRPGREGTDFTIQTVLTHLSGMIVAVSSGKIADQFQYTGLFAFELLIATIALLYAFIAFKNTEK